MDASDCVLCSMPTLVEKRCPGASWGREPREGPDPERRAGALAVRAGSYLKGAFGRSDGAFRC